MYQNHDSYPEFHEVFNGGVPVWLHFPRRFRTVGATLLNAINVGEILHAGSPVYYDSKLHSAKILKTFKVTDVSTSGSNTIITIAKNSGTPELYAGMNIMVCPSTLSGTGKAITLTSAMLVSGDTSYVVTVPTANIDAVTTTDYMVEASASGSGASLYCIPADISVYDTVGAKQNTLSLSGGEATAYRNTIPDMPEIVFNNIKSNNPLINWEYFPEVSE